MGCFAHGIIYDYTSRQIFWSSQQLTSFQKDWRKFCLWAQRYKNGQQNIGRGIGTIPHKQTCKDALDDGGIVIPTKTQHWVPEARQDTNRLRRSKHISNAIANTLAVFQHKYHMGI